MIGTPEIQEAQRTGIFTLESSGEPKEIVLIVGSCRCVAFLNYLNRYNQSAGRPFRIYYIEPFNYSHAQRIGLETNEQFLALLRSATIFIHEHFGNYDMFNTSRDAEKNIYQFGIRPKHDISIPNFHDHFILEGDYADCGVPLPEDYYFEGEAAVEKFCHLCFKTSFPEMAQYFADNWRKKRFFWRPNHTSAEFTLYIFRLMNEKFLKLPLDDAFWNGAGQEDLFKSPCTQVTDNDVRNYRLEWR